MSVLDIKNFPDELYEELRKRAKKEHRSVSQQVIHLLSETLEPAEPTSILELRGLGKSTWVALDAARHVAEERDSWD